jgi:hypothetical protein
MTSLQTEKRMVDIATGDLDQTAPAAKELAIALGRKGGRARAENFDFDDDGLASMRSSFDDDGPGDGRGDAGRVGGGTS